MDIRTAFEQGRFLEVIEAGAEACTPEDDLMVAVSLLKLGRETEAARALNAISERVSGLVRAELHLARIHRSRGDTEAARACAERYLGFHPDDDEALDLLQDDQGEEPLVSDVSPGLAGIYAGQGHYRQALEIYSRLRKERGLTPELEREERKVQSMHVIKTLEGWLERTRR